MNPSPAWEYERSVDVHVPVTFAWEYMTDVRNWSDPPAKFTLEGPFADGARGTTQMPDQAPLEWTLRDVVAGRGYTIEARSFLENASLSSHWRFERMSDQTTRLTQRLELSGDNAAAYVGTISRAFEPNLEQGLRRIAGMMTERRRMETGDESRETDRAPRGGG